MRLAITFSVCLTLVLLILSTIGSLGLIAYSADISSSQTQYKWTIMIYLDADNNLESAGISDFNEMEVAGSTNDVAIIVLMDRIEGYDETNGNWTGARIYRVLHDIDNETINSELLLDLGEVNMGDPSTVVFFVNYTVTYFPAEHYVLVFWDHGSGWKRSEGISVKGICWDYTDGDYLTQSELREIVNESSSLGIHLDIVGFDACLMQMIEVAYDFIDFADIMVASEEYEPLDGWYYTNFLVPLILNPNMSSAELASKIVDAYEYYYTNILPLPWTTLSAVNLTALNDVITYLDSMAKWLTYEVYFYPNNASTIKILRDKTQSFGSGDYIDLYHFAMLIYSTPGFVYDPRPSAYQLMNSINKSIIANYASPSYPNAYGVSIYFPPTVDWYLEERYWYIEQVPMAYYTWWGWFLDYFFKTMTPTEEFKVKPIAPAMALPGSDITIYVLTNYGSSSIYVDSISIYLVHPSGLEEPVPCYSVKPGLYIGLVSLPNDASDTYLVRVEAEYWFLSASDGASIYVSKELSSIPRISDNIDEIIYNLDTLSSDINKLSSDLNQLRALIELYGGYIDYIKNNTATIRTILGEINVSISDLKPRIVDIQDNVVTLETTIGEIKTTLDTIGPTITNIENGIATIQTSLGEITGRIEYINNTIVAIKTDVGDLKLSLSTVQDTINTKFTSIESVLSTIDTNVGNINNKVESIDTSIRDIKNTLSTYSVLVNSILILVILVLIASLISTYRLFKIK